MGRRKKQPETKDEQVETKAGEPTQTVLLKDDRVLHYVNSFKGYLAKKETIVGHYRNARKAAKAEGIDPSLVDEAIKLERGDADEFRARFQNTAQMLKIMNAPFQLAIFDSRFGDPVAQAEAEGRHAGRNGRTMDCRWPEGSPPADAYIAAYQEEQANLVNGGQQTVEEQADLEDEIEKGVAGAGLANRDPVEQHAS